LIFWFFLFLGRLLSCSCRRGFDGYFVYYFKQRNAWFFLVDMEDGLYIEKFMRSFDALSIFSVFNPLLAIKSR